MAPQFSLSQATTDPWKLVDLEQPLFKLAAAWILFNPVFWNIVARLEFNTHFLTKIWCGNRYVGCYFLAVVIFVLGLGRDYVRPSYALALAQQPTVVELGEPHFLIASYALPIGFIFVMSSFFKLGVTGTFLGDYFGILMDAKVEGFPFNVLDNPMYIGSTMMFAGTAIRASSAAGLLLTFEVWVVYMIASIFFENPFTSYIYSQRATQGGKKSPAKSPAKSKLKKSQ